MHVPLTKGGGCQRNATSVTSNTQLPLQSLVGGCADQQRIFNPLMQGEGQWGGWWEEQGIEGAEWERKGWDWWHLCVAGSYPSPIQGEWKPIPGLLLICRNLPCLTLLLF